MPGNVFHLSNLVCALITFGFHSTVLAQTAEPETIPIEYVYDPEDLVAAVDNRVKHIIIKAHLDFTNISFPDARGSLPLVISSSTQSIRGDCLQQRPPDIVRAQRSAHQCVITVDAGFVQVTQPSSTLLISDLYVMLNRTASIATEEQELAALISIKQGSVWMVSIELVGDKGNCRAGDVAQAQKMYAHLCSFTGFKSDVGAAWKLAAGARGGFRTCDIIDNHATRHGPALALSAGTSSEAPAEAWLRDCTVSNNISPWNSQVSITNQNSRVYNNYAHQTVFVVEEGVDVAPRVFSELSLEQRTKSGFIVASGDTYSDIAEEQAQLAGLMRVEIETPAPEDHLAPPSSSISTPSVTIIAAAAVGAVCAAALLGMAMLLLMRRRAAHCVQEPAANRNEGSHGKPYRPSASVTHGSMPRESSFYSSDAHSMHPPAISAPYSYAPPMPWGPSGARSPSAASTRSFQSLPPDPAALHSVLSSIRPELRLDGSWTGETSRRIGATTTYGAVSSQGSYRGARAWRGSFRTPARVSAPSNSIPPWDRAALDAALDALHASSSPFLGRFRILGSAERRLGGQGVVQFATGIQDNVPYAIKFFTKPAAFEREQLLYARPDLRTMMPAVKDIFSNSSLEITTPHGWVYPPCIVVERGESLNEWARRITPDFPTILTVLCHVALRLRQLHGVGLAHRDIKPGNILWRPKHHSWCLIDFGCAAEIGSPTPLSFSLTYAPPEAIHAYCAGAQTILSDPASDMWALGIVAYELLSGCRAFPREIGHAAVMDQILGRAPLPWETPEMRRRRMPQLRMLRPSVLSCLDRDPARRPTAEALLLSWNHLFDAATKDTWDS